MYLKKTLAFALSLGVLSSAMPTINVTADDTAEAIRYYYGDLDRNERLDIHDLCALRAAVSGNTALDEITQKQSDLNDDGTVNAADAELLNDYLLAAVKEFPSGVYFTVDTTLAYNGQKKLTGSRQIEKLDRGTYAVSNGSGVFVSWRLMAQDEPDIAFNVYRTTDGVTTKLNFEPLTNGTNFVDNTADMSRDNTYFVKTVYNNVESETDGSYTLKAGESVFVKGNSGAAKIIPINQGGTIHFVWVGDFNGDGRYDYLVDRCADDHQKLEAYLDDGTYLWTLDLGYNSENKNNITPGASTIDVGMWDGATVYDIDLDGHAEVMVRIADGVTFGDGTVHKNSITDGQDIAVLDGMTGTLKTSAPVPDDKIDVGPKACMMEIGYLDGRTPSLITWIKNRNSDKSFNSYMVAYHMENGKLVQQWKANAAGAEAHQFRVEDIDYDGKDEVLHMGYVLNSDGSLRWSNNEIIHGDRWHVAPFSNADNGKEMLCYGVQQRHENYLLEYIINMNTGKMLWTNYAADKTGELIDVGRGDIGDVDPTHEGYEVWSFQGMYDKNGSKISDTNAYPSLKLYWDGDLLSESYNDSKIEKWNYQTQSVERVATTWKIAGSNSSERGAPMFYGDILGDWREEIICCGYNWDSLIIYSTTIPTDYRLNTLSQDPAYRNDMTSKGYYQSNMLSYYLGDGMDTPPQPDVAYVGEVALEDGAVYMIKNVNSGQYLEVKDGTAEDGANVQQWGAYGPTASNTWRLVSDGNGFYYLVSQLAGGETYYLDVAGGNAANGTNVQIWEKSGSKGQQFTMTKNPDGSYVIHTNCYTGGVKVVEVADASTSSGANIQEMKGNGSSCQSWIFEKVS